MMDYQMVMPSGFPISYGGFHKLGYPNSWMVVKNFIEMHDEQGYPYFRPLKSSKISKNHPFSWDFPQNQPSSYEAIPVETSISLKKTPWGFRLGQFVDALLFGWLWPLHRCSETSCRSCSERWPKISRILSFPYLIYSNIDREPEREADKKAASYVKESLPLLWNCIFV